MARVSPDTVKSLAVDVRTALGDYKVLARAASRGRILKAVFTTVNGLMVWAGVKYFVFLRALRMAKQMTTASAAKMPAPMKKAVNDVPEHE